MVIRASSAKQVDALLAQLCDGSPVQRETAIARLRVIGARAVDRLAALARGDSPDGVRVAALRALEGSDDPRSRDAALVAAAAPSPAVAAAAVAALRPWLSADAAVLDTVAALALDKARPAAARLAALDLLSDLPRAVVQPILQQVGSEDVELAARATGQQRGGAFDDPSGLRDWVAKRGETAPFSELHDAIVRLRERERDEPSARRRHDWQAARAAAHHALARRGSRVALYDLRETFDAASSPLPLEFLHAATHAGDATCLEPMAHAWAAAGPELWWRDRLAEAGRAIAAREQLTGRHAVVRRIRGKYPGFL